MLVETRADGPRGVFSRVGDPRGQRTMTYVSPDNPHDDHERNPVEEFMHSSEHILIGLALPT